MIRHILHTAFKDVYEAFSVEADHEDSLAKDSSLVEAEELRENNDEKEEGDKEEGERVEAVHTGEDLDGDKEGGNEVHDAQTAGTEVGTNSENHRSKQEKLVLNAKIKAMSETKKKLIEVRAISVWRGVHMDIFLFSYLAHPSSFISLLSPLSPPPSPTTTLLSSLSPLPPRIKHSIAKRKSPGYLST